MNQISTMPSTAEAMPAKRSELSGLSIALAARRLAARGKAANNRPSITSTRPIATMNSVISAQPVSALVPLLFRRAGRGRRTARRSTPFTRLARRIDKVPEEVGVGLEQQSRIVGFHPSFVGLHGPVEREEVGVLAVRLGEDPVSLRIALAAGLLALR